MRALPRGDAPSHKDATSAFACHHRPDRKRDQRDPTSATERRNSRTSRPQASGCRIPSNFRRNDRFSLPAFMIRAMGSSCCNQPTLAWLMSPRSGALARNLADSASREVCAASTGGSAGQTAANLALASRTAAVCWMANLMQNPISSRSVGSSIARLLPQKGCRTGTPQRATLSGSCAVSCRRLAESAADQRDDSSLSTGISAPRSVSCASSSFPYAEQGVSPVSPMPAFTALQYSFSLSRAASRSPRSLSLRDAVGLSRYTVRFSSSITVFLLDRLLCSSRQAAPTRAASSRRFTTSRAAIFSETKRTFLPSATAAPIRLTMVWDFPVPGGP